MNSTVKLVSVVTIRLSFIIGLLSIDGLFQNGYAQSYSNAKVTVSLLRDSIYLFSGAGGNQIISLGLDGALLVDAGYSEMALKIRDQLSALGVKKVRYLINTHWHPDHTDGNRTFPTEVIVIAHQSVRDRLSFRDNLPEWAWNAVLPPESLPDVTFSDSLTLFHNGGAVVLIKRGLCHTDGDITVYFTKSRIISLGDVFIDLNEFPPLNPSEGCSVLELEKTISSICEELPDDVIIVSGHGSTGGLKDLRALRDMIRETIKIVSAQIERGHDYKKIITTSLPQLYADWGNKYSSHEEWLGLVYYSLKRDRGAK